MAESNDLTLEMDNVFIPKYVPDNLKWYEKDGLETWCRKNKCEEFLSNTDLHFKKRKIVNFDIIKNDVDKKNYSNIRQLTMMRLKTIHHIFKIKSDLLYFEIQLFQI